MVHAFSQDVTSQDRAPSRDWLHGRFVSTVLDASFLPDVAGMCARIIVVVFSCQNHAGLVHIWWAENTPLWIGAFLGTSTLLSGLTALVDIVGPGRPTQLLRGPASVAVPASKAAARIGPI